MSEDWQKYAADKAEQDRKQRDQREQDAEEARQRTAAEKVQASAALEQLVPTFEGFKKAMGELLEIDLKVERGTVVSGGPLSGKTLTSGIKFGMRRLIGAKIYIGRVDLAYSAGDTIATRIVQAQTDTSSSMKVADLSPAQAARWLKETSDHLFSK